MRERGLSPQARGERVSAPGGQARGGPIPAGAGGTSRKRNHALIWKAYPRRRGGNPRDIARSASRRGRSPLARGVRASRPLSLWYERPIPAGAGGTTTPVIALSVIRAYPRRRGGNPTAAPPPMCLAGLSPQARGEPWTCHNGTQIQGPIPAGAGGTTPLGTPANSIGAYPRRRGGNHPSRRGYLSRSGLSPQARGERSRAHEQIGEEGPIPAGAGGTSTIRATAGSRRAYPRRRGGNKLAGMFPNSGPGLSPQARGEQHTWSVRHRA